MREPSFFKILAILEDSDCHLSVVLIYIFPMINTVEHFTHTLLPLAYLFLSRYLFFVEMQKLFRYSGAKSNAYITYIFSHSNVSFSLS